MSRCHMCQLAGGSGLHKSHLPRVLDCQVPQLRTPLDLGKQVLTLLLSASSLPESQSLTRDFTSSPRPEFVLFQFKLYFGSMILLLLPFLVFLTHGF